MKKYVFLAIAAIAIGSSAFAGPASANSKVNEHFASTFSKASHISWKLSEHFEKVSFELNKEQVEVFYDTEGELIGTSKSMKLDQVPKAVLKTITTRYTYPEYRVKDCIEFSNASNEKNYYLSFEKKDENIVVEITKNGIASVVERNRK